MENKEQNSIKKQFRVSKKVNEEIKKITEELDITETQWLNNLLKYRINEYNLYFDIKKILAELKNKKELKRIRLYTEKLFCGNDTKYGIAPTIDANLYKQSFLEIENSQNPNYKYWICKTEVFTNGNNVNVLSYNTNFFDDDFKYHMFINESYRLDRTNLQNINE